MCGLFGWSYQAGSRITPEAKAVIAAGLCLENERRGDDSWGVYNGHKVSKGLGPISESVTGVHLARQLSLMAHTRYATMGAVTVANAHPFTVKGLVGAHNGVVYNHAALNQMYGRRCTVDSQHLIYHLAEGRSLSDIVAYGTVTFQRVKQPTIYVGTFNGGILATAVLMHQGVPQGVVYSSSGEALSRVLCLAGVYWRTYDLKEGLCYAILGGDIKSTKKILRVSAPTAQRWQPTDEDA